MKISIIGLGYVGLTVALGFADKGFSVSGYDTNSNRAAIIRDGLIPFFEPGLISALQRTLGKNFTVSKTAEEASVNADAIFFCVGTPCGENGNADMQLLLNAIDSVLKTSSPECVFIIKSTIPPGTTANEITPYTRSKGFNGSVVVNPEFLREGYCWKDFSSPDRTVCGCDENDAFAIELLTEIYKPFEAPIHFVSPNTAEFIKYLSNSFLASLISFSNEMSLIADAVGNVNIAKAFKVLHQDNRLAGSGINHYIYPGCGYGGYCLPKDTTALSVKSKQKGYSPRILDGVISLNNEMPTLTAQRIQRLADSSEAKIGILGLAFKPKSDDVRDSPAAKIIECLINDGYNNIYAYDPVAADAFRNEYGFEIDYRESKESLCEICDVIAVVAVWEEFQGVHLEYPQKKWCDCRYWLEGEDLHE